MCASNTAADARIRCGKAVSGGGALRAKLQLFRDNLAGGILAAAAAAADRKLTLNFEQGAGAVVDGLANLTITYCMADANVHLSPSLITGP